MLLTFLLPAAVALTPDSGRIADDLHALTTLRSRHVLHADHALATDHIRSQLEAIDGLVITEEVFTDDDYGTLTNLIAEIPGQTDTPVILGAHYDSTAAAEDDYRPAEDDAPGADDDASGVSAILEVARLLAGGRYRHPIRFVLFDGEEVGLLGSHHHAPQYTDIRMALILDPIGYNPGDVLFFSYDSRWSAEAEALMAVATDLEVYGVDQEAIGGDSRSDHWPFWLAGLPALHCGTFPQPPTYHTARDEYDVVDQAFLTEITRLIAEHVTDLAGTPEEDSPVGGCATVSARGGGGLLGLLLSIWGGVWRRSRR
ncbi:MAG: M28 family metallopeptidase [Myxococcota bacterium]|nr:M28 family metallopeptidase [Myxococcota bacterium]